MKDFVRYLKKELSLHGTDYLMLAAAGVFFLFALKLFQGQQEASLLVASLFILFYIVWGVQHHGKSRNLHIKNVLEYVLVALIVFVFILILFTIK